MTELKITQADRELLVEVLNPCSSTAESIRQGKSYTWEVAQLARHRIAAEEGIIAAIEQMYDNGESIDGLLVNNDLRAALARVRGEG